jgi:hypothetical protein
MLMWPVFILQFNFGFLINDAGGNVALITFYIYQFSVFLGLSKSYKSGLLGGPLIMLMWPAFILQFNGRFLINNAGHWHWMQDQIKILKILKYY